MSVEGVGEFANDIIWHGVVDLARQFDETCRAALLTGLPGEVERVDRNAVPPQSRSGI